MLFSLVLFFGLIFFLTFNLPHVSILIPNVSAIQTGKKIIQHDGGGLFICGYLCNRKEPTQYKNK